MRSCIVFCVLLFVCSVWADDKAPATPAAAPQDHSPALSAIKSQADQILSNVDKQSKALGNIEKAQRDLSNTVGKEVVNSLKAQGPKLDQLLDAVKNQPAAQPQAGGSSQEVLTHLTGLSSKADEHTTVLGQINAAATASRDSLADLSKKVSDITSKQEKGASGDVTKRLTQLETEIREIKSLLQKALAASSSQDNKGLLDRLQSSQERILERLNGGVLDHFGNAWSWAHNTTAKTFDCTTAYLKKGLRRVKEEGATVFTELKPAHIAEVVTTESKNAYHWAAARVVESQQTLESHMTPLFTQYNLPTEHTGKAALGVVGLVGLIASFITLRILAYVICCGCCRRKKVSNSQKKKNKKAKKAE